MKTLNDIKNGKRCIVGSISGDSSWRNRIMQFGVIKGAELLVIKRAPFGDPIEISVLDGRLVFRVDDAKKINVIEL